MAKTPTLGKGDWTDYQDYWRDDDAEWLMERTVLRYDTDTLRNSEWPNPTAGQVIYNASVGTLQVRSASGWLNLFGRPSRRHG